MSNPQEHIDHLTRMLALVLSRVGNTAVFTDEEVKAFMRDWEGKSRIVSITHRGGTMTVAASYEQQAELVMEWMHTPGANH